MNEEQESLNGIVNCVETNELACLRRKLWIAADQMATAKRIVCIQVNGIGTSFVCISID